jgi:heme-degrading monooxygenase HmoA
MLYTISLWHTRNCRHPAAQTVRVLRRFFGNGCGAQLLITDVTGLYRQGENIMTVKIFIRRKVAPANILELTVLLKKLRALTLSQPGYIYGETLKRLDLDDECMVISTWRSQEDWNAWFNNEQRIRIQTEIDQLLGEKTEYAIYEI